MSALCRVHGVDIGCMEDLSYCSRGALSRCSVDFVGPLSIPIATIINLIILSASLLTAFPQTVSK